MNINIDILLLVMVMIVIIYYMVVVITLSLTKNKIANILIQRAEEIMEKNPEVALGYLDILPQIISKNEEKKRIDSDDNLRIRVMNNLAQKLREDGVAYFDSGDFKTSLDLAKRAVDLNQYDENGITFKRQAEAMVLFQRAEGLIKDYPEKALNLLGEACGIDNKFKIPGCDELRSEILEAVNKKFSKKE